MIGLFSRNNIISSLPLFSKGPFLYFKISSNGIRTLAADVKKIGTKLPKRMTVLSLFMKDNYESVKSENTGKAHRELFKIVIDKYKSMSAEQLKKYKLESEKSLEAYKKAKDSLSDKEKDALLLLRRVRKARNTGASAKKTLNALKAEHNYPIIKFKTAYGQFISEKSASVMKDQTLTVKDRIAKLGQMWRELAEASKARYAEAAAKARQQSRDAVVKWEADMKKKGLGNVVDKIKELSTADRSAKLRATNLETGNVRGRPTSGRRKLTSKVAKKRKSSVRSGAKRQRRRGVGVKVKSIRKRPIKKSAKSTSAASSKTKSKPRKLTKSRKTANKK